MSVIVALGVALFTFGCEFNLIPSRWIVSWLRPTQFVGYFFAFLAIQNYFDLQTTQAPRRFRDDDDDRPPWAR
jgi:hypothetical protein